MRLSRLVPIFLLLLGGCHPVPPGTPASGTISGAVYMTAPIGGVVVTAYSVNPATGALGDAIGSSSPTAADGSFSIDLGVYYGPLLLEARGLGATYTEPASGTTVTWDAAQTLRAVWTTWTPTKALSVDYVRGSSTHGFIISPITELALDYALATTPTASSFAVALTTSTLLFRDHLEVDFWQQLPLDFTVETATTWAAPATFGLELAGLSELVTRMATDSATSGLSSMDLLRLLTLDAQDALFDGKSLQGPLLLGTCKMECVLSDETLRSDWSDSMAVFLSSGVNMTGLATSAVTTFLTDVATRQSALFPGGGSDFDITPPTISVVETTVLDEATNTDIPLNGTSVATFSRYPTDYSPSSTGIPKIHFQITDDRSADDTIAVEAHLIGPQGIEVVPWTPVPYDPQNGYNREVVISTDYWPAISSTSGAFTLEVRASDQSDNGSPPVPVQWNQTILGPRTPVLGVVATTALDYGPVTAHIVGAAPGSVQFSGSPASFTLDGTSTPAFARWASSYGPSDLGVPIWHFLVSEPQVTDASTIAVTATLTRDNDGAVLLSNFAVPYVAGGGYTQQIVISNALHPDIGLVSGTYHLDLVATDSAGVASAVLTVRWTQTVMMPPLQLRAGPACDVNTDASCPARYSLQGSLGAEVPITGGTVGKLHVASAYLDNPNPIPLRVRFNIGAAVYWSEGRAPYVMPLVPAFGYTANCQPSALADGTCYTIPTNNAEAVLIQQTSSITTSVLTLLDGQPFLACNDCGPDERIVPASSTLTVWAVSQPYTFMWPSGYPLGTIGNSNPNLPATAVGGPCEKFVDYVEAPSPSLPNGQVLYCQTWWYLTRLAATPNAILGIESRLNDAALAFGPAAGSSSNSFFSMTPSLWNTAVSGGATFPQP